MTAGYQPTSRISDTDFEAVDVYEDDGCVIVRQGDTRIMLGIEQAHMVAAAMGNPLALAKATRRARGEEVSVQ